MNKTKTLLTGVALASALALTGCGGTNPSAPADKSAAIDGSPAKGKVTIWAFDNESKALTALATEFTKKNPDAQIDVVPVAADQLPRKIDAAVAGGVVPEIVQPTIRLSSFVASDYVAAVPEGVFKDADYFPSAVKDVTVKGTKYALPWYVDAHVLYYRADLAEAAGVKAPSTWNEALSFGKALQKEGVANGFAVGGSGALSFAPLTVFMYQAGEHITNADNTKFTFDSPENVKALTYFQSIFKDGVTTASYAPTAAGEQEAAFGDGSVGSFISSAYSYPLAVQAVGGDARKVGIALLPEGPKTGGGFLGGSGLAVMKDATNQDAAWKFLKFVGQADSSVTSFKVSGILPANQTAWSDPEIAQSPLAEAMQKQINLSQPLPKIGTFPEIRALITEYAEKVARSVLTPKQAAEEMQKAAEKIGTGQ